MYTFKEIKKEVLKWSQTEMPKLLMRDNLIEYTKNDEDILLIDLSFEHCLAQIIVNRPSYAPYQYVSFESLSLNQVEENCIGIPEMVCFFYDSPRMTKKQVIDKLSCCIELCSKYNPA